MLISVDEGWFVPKFLPWRPASHVFSNRASFDRTLCAADGHAIIINFLRRTKLSEFQFKKSPIRDIQFSPDGKYFAVTAGRHLQVWESPAPVAQFRPLQLHRTYTGHYDEVLCIEWSSDSQFIVTGSRDNTARVYSLHPIPGFSPLSLTGHRSSVGCPHPPNATVVGVADICASIVPCPPSTCPFVRGR